jgi:hypothetical protein
MTEFSLLEKDVVSAILSGLVGDQDKVAHVIQSLSILDRSFSRDVIDGSKCSGFYLNFESNSVLAHVKTVPHHLSVHASSEATPAGGDFILFFSQETRGIDFLEATFFDFTLPIDQLLKQSHGFTIRQVS